MPKELDTTSRVIIIGNSPSILLNEYASCKSIIILGLCILIKLIICF